MKDIYKFVLIACVGLVFSGCTFTQVVVGEYYLSEKKYNSGVTYFNKKVSKNNLDSASYYYLGRLLLAQNRSKQALVEFKNAIALDNTNADYYCWLGVAYSSLKKLDKERYTYLKALELNSKHLQALTYLAHNYNDANEYENALFYYKEVLSLSPFSQTALFNHAILLKKLKRYPEEKLALKEYLKYYVDGSLARNATVNLNLLGNFDFRNYIIGIRTITLKRIEFKPFISEIDYNSRDSLNYLCDILSRNKKVKIHIVVYQEGNEQLAKDRAKSVKKYILEKSEKIDPNRLKLSWFGVPKVIIKNGTTFKLGESVDFITDLTK